MRSAPVVPGCNEQLGLVPGASCAGGDGTLRLLTWRRVQSFGADLAWKRAVLTRLANEPYPSSELDTAAGGEVADRAPVGEFVAALAAGGWLISTVRHQGRALYTLAPVDPVPPAPDQHRADLVLSRFTVMHRESDRLVVESPLASARMEVHDPAVLAVLGGLGGAARPEPAAWPLPAEATIRLLADLQRTGLAVPAASERDAGLRSLGWKPHELWFHHRTRTSERSYATEGYGRTQWAKGRFAPLPAGRERYPGPAVELRRPDLDRLRVNDTPLTAVIEDRRSTRQFDDDHPITADQLGELLYRCARVRRSLEHDGVEYLSKPYPSGGGVYELELYPVVRLASGLDPGMYHYDPHGHRLRLVRAPGSHTRRLLLQATHSTMDGRAPQVLVLVAARFGRLMWTYEQMPYSLVLKHVGVLYQTMYLVATAMGLAACGIGGGDATAFNEATGADYLTESAVGEFLLGSRPPDGQPGGPHGPAVAS